MVGNKQCILLVLAHMHIVQTEETRVFEHLSACSTSPL